MWRSTAPHSLRAWRSSSSAPTNYPKGVTMHDEIKVNQALASGAFEFVHLYTAEGGFVAKVLIPVFRPKPRIVSWGQRLFHIDSEGTYHECFWFAVVSIEGVTSNGL